MTDGQQKKRRNPYADTGLMIAMAMLIVMIIKCFLFGVTWESFLWFALAIGYCVISYLYDSESKVVRHSTTGLIVLSVIAAVAITIIDRKPQPKMHAFEGVVVDTVKEDEFIQQQEPILPELEKETATIPDTILPETFSNPETPEQQADMPEVPAETETTEETI